MFKQGRISGILGLVVIGLLLPPMAVLAQTPTPEATQTPTPEVVQTPESAAAAGGLDLTFEDLEYTDQVLRHDGDTAAYTLYMPRSFELSADNYLEIIFSYFMLNGSVPADLEVYLNDVLLGQASLSQAEAQTEGEERRLRLALAPESLMAESNQLRIRLRTHEICDVYEPEVEVVVDAASYFRLVYATPPLTPDLADYPYPFYERTFQGSQVYIVLPENPSAADLSAAATVSAGLGREARIPSRLAITSTLDSELTRELRDNYNLIVIGQPGTNRVLDQLRLPTDVKSPQIGAEHGVLQVLASPWNPARAVLVITGRSDTALYRASAALNRGSFLPGIRGQASIITDVLPPPLPAAGQASVDRTFARLGYEDQIVYGIAPNLVRYTFFLPRAFEVPEAPRLTLSFSHSSIIDPATSTLDVIFNNVPIGGTLLDETNQKDGLLELELPQWLLQPGQNRLYVQIGMHFSDDHCVDSGDPRAWTVLFKNSYLHLPLVPAQEELDLAFFPAPFAGNGHYEDTLFVAPRNMTMGQRNRLLRLAANLGAAGESNYLALHVVYDVELSEANQADKHLVLIGRPSRNLVFQDDALAATLPQPFEPGTDLILPRHDSVVVQQSPDTDIGLLQEFPSPWNPERAILAVTGTTDQGVGWSLQALISLSRSLEGNLVVVDEEGIRRALYVGEVYTQPASSRAADVAPVGADTRQALRLAEKWW